MIDLRSATFAEVLEHEINLLLHGKGDTPGLYEAFLGAQIWDDVVRIKAMIHTYKEVLALTRDINRRINEGEEPIRASLQLAGRGIF